MYLAAAPANAMLFAAQIHRTPDDLQGRVVAAALLVAGSAAPLGPPLAGLMLDHAGRSTTFVVLASATAALTIGVHVNRAIRTVAAPS